MNRLTPPQSLDKEPFFVVLWERHDDSYALLLRDRRSYNLGNGEQAVVYLRRACRKQAKSDFAERAVDTARNFVACTAEPFSGKTHVSDKMRNYLYPPKTEMDLLRESAQEVPYHESWLAGF